MTDAVIGIKQRSLAGELETGLKVVSRVLTELRATGLIHVIQHKYHSKIRIFLTPQGSSATPDLGVAETPESPLATPDLGVPGTPDLGVPNALRSCTDVQRQQRPAGAREADRESISLNPLPTRGPTEKQLNGITSMATELDIPAPEPQDRLAADVVFRELRKRVEAHRAKRRGKKKSSGPDRPHVIEYSKIDRQSRCRVCGAWNPSPRSECSGA